MICKPKFINVRSITTSNIFRNIQISNRHAFWSHRDSIRGDSTDLGAEAESRAICWESCGEETISQDQTNQPQAKRSYPAKAAVPNQITVHPQEDLRFHRPLSFSTYSYQGACARAGVEVPNNLEIHPKV